jgi:dimethylglycine dehydrogenase
MNVEAGDCDPPYMANLWHNGRIVGEVTSAAWGYRVGACVALGMLRADLTAPGTKLEVEVFGDRIPAVVQPDGPLWDPANERIKN